MNVVDSSAWLEYFADGPNAEAFAPVLEDGDALIVPTICIYEVFKSVLRQRGEAAALSAIAVVRRGSIVELSEPIALRAAALSLKMKLPMAYSVILATAYAYGAHVWTQDADFEGLEGVTVIAKA